MHECSRLSTRYTPTMHNQVSHRIIVLTMLVASLAISSCKTVVQAAAPAAQELIAGVQPDVQVEAPGHFIVSSRVVFVSADGAAHIRLFAPTLLGNAPTVVFDKRYDAGAQVMREIVLFKKGEEDWLSFPAIGCQRLRELLMRDVTCVDMPDADEKRLGSRSEKFEPVRVYPGQ